MSSRLFARGCRWAAWAVLLLAPAGARAAGVEVLLPGGYLPAGGTMRGVVRVDAPSAGALLTVSVVRQVDVRDPRGKPGPAALLSRQIAKAAPLELPFTLDAAGILFGTLRVKAELTAGKTALAAAWGEPVQVGLRRRVSLAGDWSVAGVKVLEGDFQFRPKEWKPPALPDAVRLPGKLPVDQAFRGWVTLKREVSWPREGDLRPRALCINGASDSARVSINGAGVGETAPAEDVAVLTHWVEFHSPYKGPENEQNRMLLLAGGFEDPWRVPLPKALPAQGKAAVEMVLRGTSGGIMGNPTPPYGVLNDLCLELAPAVWIRSVSFDADKPGEKRRLKFRLSVANESGAPFKGKLRAVYGQYAGDRPYTGACPEIAEAAQALSLPAGASTVEVVREEQPRFATCRATFVLLDGAGRPLDAAQQQYHTVCIETRDRRDLYLNNERFLVKGQGSYGEDANTRLQLRVKGGNAFRGHRSYPSRRVPGLMSEAECINDRYRDGLLTSAGSALLASCEKCTFWNPKDTSNIDKAVRGIIRRLAQCPGIIDWEATNELHGEPEEARVAILEAFHKYDPYHRPVLATKSSGEWEAEAHEGRVAGVDIVGCQYLLSKEATDSVTAAITEQPIMSTEVNWNDATLYDERRLFDAWMEKGVCGSLFFDYSGNALDQPVPASAPPDGDNNVPGYVVRESQRLVYQDLTAAAVRDAGGQVCVTVANRMPYALRGLRLSVRQCGTFRLPDLPPGDGAAVTLPPGLSPAARQRLFLRADYTTHGGLKHSVLLAPVVTEGGRR